MIQTILALTIVALAVGKTFYSLYRSLKTRDKSLCGGCASCDLKNELKKKGKLNSQNTYLQKPQIFAGGSQVKYLAER
jgi:hypothetical protein